LVVVRPADGPVIAGTGDKVFAYVVSRVEAREPAEVGLLSLEAAVDICETRGGDRIRGDRKRPAVGTENELAGGFALKVSRGVQVFANIGATTLIGDDSGSFAGYIPRTYNWGVSLTRPRYNIRANWNYSGRARQSIVAAGRSIEPGTYTWGSKRLIVDLSGECLVYKRWSVFMNLSNFTDEPIDIEIAGPSTPEHAQFRSRTQYGAQWTFGLKTTF
jgi:hypothetical protein